MKKLIKKNPKKIFKENSLLIKRNLIYILIRNPQFLGRKLKLQFNRVNGSI